MNPPDSKPKATGRIKKIVHFHPFKAIFISVQLFLLNKQGMQQYS